MMKTKITMFLHSRDCSFVWLGVRRKHREKIFEIEARNGWELASKINRLMLRLLCFVLFFVGPPASGEPGWDRRDVIRGYLPHWNIERFESAGYYDYWYLSSAVPGVPAKMILKFSKKTGLITETQQNFYCPASGKRIWEMMESRLKKIDDYWYIHQPCLNDGCDGEMMLIGITLYNDYYIIRRKLWKHQQ